MGEPLAYSVVLKTPAAPNLLAQALAPIVGRPAQDLVLPLRRCRGLIDWTPDAVAAAAALEKAGIPAVAVPKNLIEEPPPAEITRAFPSKPAARLLVAGAFTRVTRKTVTEEVGPGKAERALKIGLSLATGIPLIGSGKKSVQRTLESSDLVYHLDVYAGGTCLRLAAHDFDFSCLKERKGYDAAGNFRRLLEWLAPGARLNPGAQALLDGKPLRELGYESLADFEREGSWLLTLAALKLQ